MILQTDGGVLLEPPTSTSRLSLPGPHAMLCALQEIASLREELGVMQRLARAQDRKFEGFEGYAMAHRLWAVEEELRLARSTAASSVAEVRLYRCLARSSLKLILRYVPSQDQCEYTSS